MSKYKKISDLITWDNPLNVHYRKVTVDLYRYNDNLFILLLINQTFLVITRQV